MCGKFLTTNNNIQHINNSMRIPPASHASVQKIQKSVFLNTIDQKMCASKPKHV